MQCAGVGLPEKKDFYKMPNTNSMLFKVELSDKTQKLLGRLSDSAGFATALARQMDNLNLGTVAAIKAKINGSPQKGLRGAQVLHRRTGRLSTSIGQAMAIVDASGKGKMIRSAVGSGVGSGSEAVRYAHIHEFGGTILVPSRPTRSTGPYGKKHPMTRAFSIDMQERSYIRSTYRERANRYTQTLSVFALKYLRNGDSSTLNN